MGSCEIPLTPSKVKHQSSPRVAQRDQQNVPDHEPPNGYICYRCGNKGHWIQLCPTNDDPDFDNRPRVKRTTGIPRSFLQKVDKSVILAANRGRRLQAALWYHGKR